MKTGAINVKPMTKVRTCVFLKLLNHVMFMRVEVDKPKVVALPLERCIVVVLLQSRLFQFYFGCRLNYRSSKMECILNFPSFPESNSIPYFPSGKNLFRKCNPPDFQFYLNMLNNNFSP